MRFLAFALAFLVTPQAILAESGQRVVVFDIDGTLTPNVIAIWDARDHAAEAATIYANAGVRVVYLSARVRLFQGGVQGWLDKNGFPQGDVFLMKDSEDRADKAGFKTGIINDVQNEGGVVIAAYGDSSSDFEAYADAGIAQDRIYALRRSGRRDCKAGVWHGCYDGWAEQLPQINALITATN